MKNNIINLKDFYIPYRNTLNLPNNASFGLEIEFNIKGYEPTIDYSYPIHGFSYFATKFMKDIGYKGDWIVENEIENRIEIISDVLNDNSNTWETLYDTLEFINSNGFYYNGFGGSHIHAYNGIIGDDFDNWINFFKLWVCYEEEIIKFTNNEYYTDRVSMDTYAKRVKKVLVNYIDNSKLKKRRIIPRDLCNKSSVINFANIGALRSVNLNNYNVKNINNTIEFRCPRLTINPVIWQNNINFFIKMMLACNSNLNTEYLNYRYNIEKNKTYSKYEDEKAFELVNFVFNNDFDKYCFLRQYYKDFNNDRSHTSMSKSTKFWK